MDSLDPLIVSNESSNSELSLVREHQKNCGDVIPEWFNEMLKN